MVLNRRFKYRLNKSNRKKLLFYIALLILPIIQFLIFYVYVNFNSILLAFKEYNPTSESFNDAYQFVWFKNIGQVFQDFATNKNGLLNALKNTGVLFLFTMLIGIPLPIFVSYFIYKKGLFYKGFKIVLYLPSVVSTFAIVLSYMYFCEVAMPEIGKAIHVTIDPLISNPKTLYGTILFFYLWFSVGSSFMIYASTMEGINPSIIEAAKLDGVNSIQEFIYIILPSIYPTIVTYIVTNIAVMFTNQMNLFSFFGIESPASLTTVGYYLYRETTISGISNYPYLAAFGIVCTIICIPLCFSIRYLLQKFGPSTK